MSICVYVNLMRDVCMGAYGDYTSRCVYYIDTYINHIPPLLVIYFRVQIGCFS